ncbi:MAG: hypothetical protein ACNA8W_25280 [Bradymonadaceae bacterium]
MCSALRMLGKSRVPTLPTAVLRGFLTVAAPAWRLLGKEPPATPGALNFLLRRSRVSNEKARQVLGFEPRIGLEEGMGEVERELRTSGQLS